MRIEDVPVAVKMGVDARREREELVSEMLRLETRAAERRRRRPCTYDSGGRKVCAVRLRCYSCGEEAGEEREWRCGKGAKERLLPGGFLDSLLELREWDEDGVCEGSGEEGEGKGAEKEAEKGAEKGAEEGGEEEDVQDVESEEESSEEEGEEEWDSWNVVEGGGEWCVQWEKGEEEGEDESDEEGR